MKKNFVILFFLGVMIGCDKENKNLTPNVDSYPMTIGTRWTYERQLIISKYESETSDNIIGIDTMNFTVKVWIDKDTVLNDTMNVTAFKSSENDINVTSTQYKFIDNQGLKTYAYSNGGAAIAFIKKSGYPASSFDPHLYSAVNNVVLTSDDIIFEDIPVLDIKLPLDISSSWTYRKTSGNLQIDKEVIGTQTLNLFGRKFACYEVRWNYLYDPDFIGFEIIDWISEYGLVKRMTIVEKIPFNNEIGETLFYGKVEETITLNELNQFKPF
jgi:hypothetical protein